MTGHFLPYMQRILAAEGVTASSPFPLRGSGSHGRLGGYATGGPALKTPVSPWLLFAFLAGTGRPAIRE